MPAGQAEILIVGTGPGPRSFLTRAAEEALMAADKVLFRTGDHPVCQWLVERGTPIVSFDFAYDIPRITYTQIYELIADVVVREATLRGRAVYALPGHPLVFESTPALIARQADAAAMPVRIVPGLSFLEIAYAELRIDPGLGLQIASAFEFDEANPPITNQRALLVGQLFAPATPAGGRRNLAAAGVGRWLRKRFPPAHPVALVWSTGRPAYDTRSARFTLERLGEECAAVARSAAAATLYVPAADEA